VPPYKHPRTAQIRPRLKVDQLKDGENVTVCGNPRSQPLPNLGPGTVTCETCIRAAGN
jgi:hypothetical protein